MQISLHVLLWPIYCCFLLFSYVHTKVDMKFLDCSPSQQPGYIDEADLFYNNPQSWLDGTFKNREESMPSYLVFFDVLFKVSFNCKRNF